MTNPLNQQGGPDTRRTYEEKQRLIVDLLMLLFGGLFRLLKKRAGE